MNNYATKKTTIKNISLFLNKAIQIGNETYLLEKRGEYQFDIPQDNTQVFVFDSFASNILMILLNWLYAVFALDISAYMGVDISEKIKDSDITLNGKDEFEDDKSLYIIKNRLTQLIIFVVIPWILVSILFIFITFILFQINNILCGILVLLVTLKYVISVILSIIGIITLPKKTFKTKYTKINKVATLNHTNKQYLFYLSIVGYLLIFVAAGTRIYWLSLVGICFIFLLQLFQNKNK